MSIEVICGNEMICFLFNSDDPTEHFDIADKYPDVVKDLQSRLNIHRTTMVPAYYPPESKKADPTNFKGVWSPGWC